MTVSSYKTTTPWSRVQPHSQGSSLRRKEEEEVVIEDLVGGMAPGLRGGGGGGGGGGVGGRILGSVFAGYVPLASQSPYSITVYSVANYRPLLVTFYLCMYLINPLNRSS